MKVVSPFSSLDMNTYWRTLIGLVSCSLFAVASYQLDEHNQTPTGSQKSWETPPDPTDSLIFNSVNNLLQQWPNARYRNGTPHHAVQTICANFYTGHAIVAAFILPGTALYHGRTDDTVPTTPEWLATDPEHSYRFCNGVCHMLTFVATREIRLVYFDGSSAAKFNTGAMDTQDMLARGKVAHNQNPWKEAALVADLCAWGKRYQVDGFVR